MFEVVGCGVFVYCGQGDVDDFVFMDCFVEVYVGIVGVYDLIEFVCVEVVELVIDVFEYVFEFFYVDVVGWVVFVGWYMEFVEEQCEFFQFGVVGCCFGEFVFQFQYCVVVYEQYGEVDYVVGEFGCLKGLNQGGQGLFGFLFVEVCIGVGFGGRDELEDVVCFFVGIFEEDGVVGVGVVWVIGVDDQEVVLLFCVVVVVVNLFDVFCVDFVVDEQQFVVLLDLLEYQQ